MEITARNLTARLIAKLLIMLGFARHARKKAFKGEYILSIYFHNPSKKEFKRCIKWLKKNCFTFLSTSDLDHIIHGDQPFPKGAVLLTVDDGWQSNESNIIETAREFCIPVTIFISTSAVEEGVFWWSYWIVKKREIIVNKRSLEAMKKVSNSERLLEVEKKKKVTFVERNALTIEQIENAVSSEYITIGSHTHTHPILTNCKESEVRCELHSSKQKLESWTGKEVKYFAYPNGDYHFREKQILKELNYRLAFNVQPRYITLIQLKIHTAYPGFLL
jgi:peptidoglycan/xylan/chitin deacetylase (PgdA/CDA1 family)